MALKRHSRRPAGRPVGYPLVLLSAFLFAAGGNVVKALFKLGYSPLVLAQLRVWSAFLGLFFSLLVIQPALFRVNLPGVMLGLVSAGFFAFYILRASTLARRLNTWSILLYGFGAGTVLWAAFDTVSGTALPTDLRIWAVMALLGLVGTLLAHGLFVMALRTVRPSTAGIIATAEPVFAGLIAYLVLGDRLQPLQIFGAAVIVAGIIAVQACSRDAAVAAPANP